MKLPELSNAKAKLLWRFKRPIIAALYFRNFPPLLALTLCRLRKQVNHRFGRGTAIRVPLGANKSIELRSGTTDFDIFEQIFLMNDCALPFRHEPRLIIDGGAHIGCSTVWFALRYPRAKIIAVEAQRENFELLRRNTEAFPNVECLHAAIWKSNEPLRLEDPEADPWGFRVVPSESENVELVPAVTIAYLLRKSCESKIGLLKLDIEGAEYGVFTDGYEGWLPYTSAIIVELHDRISPGCTAAFRAAIGHYNFASCPNTRHNAIAQQVP